MGQLQLSEIRVATKWALDNRTNVSNTQLDRWINWAYQELGLPRIHRHLALQAESNNAITLVTDQVAYDLPVLLGYSVWGIYGIWYVDGTSALVRSNRRHKLKGGFDVRSLDDTNSGTGRPTRYAVWGATASTTNVGPVVQLDRRPTATENGRVLLVRAYRAPARLTADAQKTVLHELWDEPLILGATYRGFRELGENARAEVAKAHYMQVVVEKQDELRLLAEDWGGAFEVDLNPYVPIS